MEIQERLTISTLELIKAMVDAGFRKKAREIGKEHFSKQELKEILSTRGDEIHIPSDFSRIASYIVEVKQKIVCKFDTKQLILYAPIKKEILIEIIDRKTHTFFIKSFDSDLSVILREFYCLDDGRDNSTPACSVKIDSDFYDLIHTMTERELINFIEEDANELIKGEEKLALIKSFLKDFKAHKQKMNPIIFTFDERINFVDFFLPGKGCIWFIEYRNIKNDEISVSCITSKMYLQAIEENIRIFFTEYLSSKDNSMINKKFSLKRGLPFFVKSNALLIIFWVLLFISKSSWASDGAVIFGAVIFQSEVLVLFYSFLACFRRDDIKIKDIK